MVVSSRMRGKRELATVIVAGWCCTPEARHTYDFEGRVWPAAAKNGVGLAAM
jgi:hypothetical protein